MPWLGLSPLPPARLPAVERREPELDGSTHLPAAPGTAHAYGRLGTTAFPVTFNWECSRQAERIRAGERNCPSVKVGQQYICVLLRLRLYFPGGHKGLAELLETPVFPEVPRERLGHELGCSFTHPNTGKKRLSSLHARSVPAPHGSPRLGGDGDAESSGDEFIPLFQLTEDDQQCGGKFAESSNAG